MADKLLEKLNSFNVKQNSFQYPISFTPEYYKHAYRNYKQGYFAEIVSLMEEAELDSHIAGCLIGRYAGFSGNWQIKEASSEKQDQLIKDFIEEQISELNIFELFEDIFDAKLKKFSVLKLIWELTDGKYIVKSTEKINQKYFIYDFTDLQYKVDFGNKKIPINNYSALVCEYKKTPVLLPVLKEFILKEFGLQSWVSFIETFGEAMIIGKYPNGADYRYKQELEAGINALGSSARGIIPEDSELRLLNLKEEQPIIISLLLIATEVYLLQYLGMPMLFKTKKGCRWGKMFPLTE